MSARVLHAVAQKRLDDAFGDILVAESSWQGMIFNAEFTHTACGFSWREIATLVINKRLGCPKCTGRKVYRGNYSIEKAQASLDKDGRGYEVVRDAWQNDALVVSGFICREDHVWYARPSHVLHNYTGCPHCAAENGYGFWTAKKYRKHGYNKLYLYQIEFYGNGKRFQKVGVSVKVDARFDQLLREISNLFGGDWQWQSLAPILNGTPEDVLKKERAIINASKKLNRQYSVIGHDFGGSSECFDELAVSWQM